MTDSPRHPKQSKRSGVFSYHSFKTCFAAKRFQQTSSWLQESLSTCSPRFAAEPHPWLANQEVGHAEEALLDDSSETDTRYQKVWLDIEKQRLLCEEQCIESYKKLLEVNKASYKGLKSPSIEEQHEVWQKSCASNAGSLYRKGDFQKSKDVKDFPMPTLFARRRTTTADLYPFQPIESPATLTIKKLQEIAQNDQDAEGESPLEYGPGGYMPVTIGQLIGPDDQYKIIRKLGWGHFSTVWLCEDVLHNQGYFAVKIVKASPVFKNVALDEISLLQCVRDKDPGSVGYDRVILLHEYFTAISMNGPHICLTFELMGPSLLDLIIQSDYQGIEQPAVKSIIKQMLEGLMYLHQNCRIIHTDIKPENILIKVKDSYIRNMVEHVNRFRELGVQMPKSYVNAARWEEHVELYEQPCEKPSSSKASSTAESSHMRDSSCPENIFMKALPKATDNNFRSSSLSAPMFVDPNIQVKIADLGNSCWENQHFAEVIQTIQYRALEVIIDAEYSFPADMWSVACVAFELSTGEYLFNPHSTKYLSTSEDHLGLIWEVLDGIPKYVALGGRKSKKYFDSTGALRHISKESMKIWKVEDVLVDKYNWKRVDAILFADFIQSLIEPDPDLRAVASSALTKKWLKELENH